MMSFDFERQNIQIVLLLLTSCGCGRQSRKAKGSVMKCGGLDLAVAFGGSLEGESAELARVLCFVLTSAFNGVHQWVLLVCAHARRTERKGGEGGGAWEKTRTERL